MSDSAAPPIRLLGHEFSLFSGKARAYLRHKQIPFVESITPAERKLIKQRVGRPVIPVIVTPDGECVQRPTTFYGEFLADDEVPQTLYPLLRRMFDEQLPVLVDTMRRVGQWAAAHPDKDRIPRFIGKHEFYLGRVKATRYVMPFAQWMFQRPLAHYRALSPGDKARIDPILGDLGGLNGLNEAVAAPLKLENYRLLLER